MMHMNREQQAEYNELKAKTETLRDAYNKLDDAALTVRVCLDPQTRGDGYRAIARKKLAERCRELVEAVEALAKHSEI